MDKKKYGRNKDAPDRPIMHFALLLFHAPAVTVGYIDAEAFDLAVERAHIDAKVPCGFGPVSMAPAERLSYEVAFHRQQTHGTETVGCSGRDRT